jgi:hypothetical protein
VPEPHLSLICHYKSSSAVNEAGRYPFIGHSQHGMVIGQIPELHDTAGSFKFVGKHGKIERTERVRHAQPNYDPSLPKYAEIA